MSWNGLAFAGRDRSGGPPPERPFRDRGSSNPCSTAFLRCLPGAVRRACRRVELGTWGFLAVGRAALARSPCPATNCPDERHGAPRRDLRDRAATAPPTRPRRDAAHDLWPPAGWREAGARREAATRRGNLFGTPRGGPACGTGSHLDRRPRPRGRFRRRARRPLRRSRRRTGLPEAPLAVVAFRGRGDRPDGQQAGRRDALTRTWSCTSSKGPVAGTARRAARSGDGDRRPGPRGFAHLRRGRGGSRPVTTPMDARADAPRRGRRSSSSHVAPRSARAGHRGDRRSDRVRAERERNVVPAEGHGVRRRTLRRPGAGSTR